MGSMVQTHNAKFKLGFIVQAAEPPKAPLCKGGCQNRHFGTDFDWGIVVFYNPSVKNQRFLPPPFAQGRLALRAPMER
jgi:hypothetical protein